MADLERYLDVTRAELLFARGVILVEGAAELFVLPALASAVHSGAGEPADLDQLGITVCATHGTDFGPYCKLLSKQGLNVPYVVVTDGDPIDDEGHVRYLGLERGAAFVSGADALLLKTALDLEAWDQARSLLREHSIYVGERTLEPDLLAHFPVEFKETYRELRPKVRAVANFETAVDEALAGDDAAATRILRRIEDVGKGRFAQRLAGKLVGREGPAYIAEAIRAIVAKVEAEWRTS